MVMLNLEHFPDVCRLCFKPGSSRKMHSTDGSFGAIQLKIQTFLDEVTYRITEGKEQYVPKMVCDTCLEQLTNFAVYRNKLILTFRFMEAFIDAKHSNPKPLINLFQDSQSELNVLFKELSLCSMPDAQVEDILQEFKLDNITNREKVVKVEKIEPSESEDDAMQGNDPDSDYQDGIENETKHLPEIVLTEWIETKRETSEVSEDDEPLSKRRKTKPKCSKTAKSRPAPKREPKPPGRPRIHPFGKKLAEPWSCDKCKFTTKLRLSVDRHKEVHERKENRSIPCTICELTFKSKTEMRAHSSTHPENQFMCEVCGTSLRNAHSLKAHMERHKVGEKQKCEYCDYTTPFPHYLKAHMKSHTSEAIKRCEICGATLRNGSLLKRHMETHGNERKYHCDQCPARFNTSNALRSHRNCVHLVIRYPCEYCEKRFDQKLTLRDHVERVHNIQCNFPCPICLLTYDTQEKLDVHGQRHENPKTLECGVCLTIHPNQEAFDGHLCITYREDYTCCNKDLRNHAQYNRHMLTKHGLKTNFRVKPIPGVLVGQLRRTRKRLLQCRKCDIAFTTKAQKVQHMIECNGLAGLQQSC
ncbi:zinc finger protein draculin-like [Armigeres subalbatus]|uniref:zinc finger protein draculin-like n=1 Tax=Armigeres subalbatus TaxID=124917 RepID=UPI002ED5577C